MPEPCRGQVEIFDLIAHARGLSPDLLTREASGRLAAAASRIMADTLYDWIKGIVECEALPELDLYRADWKTVSGEALRTALAAVFFAQAQTALPSGKPRMVRETSLSFYPDWTLAEIYMEAADNSYGIATLLLAEGSIVLLDGTTSPIHDLNLTEPSQIDLSHPDQIIDYLRFFCAFVHGEHGPFRVVESVTEAQFTHPIGVEEQETFDTLLHPVNCSPSEDGAFQLAACVSYAGALFHTQFQIQPGGMVKTFEDELKMDGLPFVRHHFDSGLRMIAKRADN